MQRGQNFRPHPSATLALSKILLVAIAQLPLVRGAPTRFIYAYVRAEQEGKDPDNPSLWIYLAVAAALVLLGGAFAGLTIALMGQDEIYLQVIKTSGEGAERKHATKVLGLLNKGKHWVLVTLLLSNVITNETLPIVLDRSLGGGWPAVLGSTVLIVVFGEIAPQSVCVRYGLPIGAWMSPFVLALMYVLAPVAWPTAKLLDYLLGEEHGTVYKKAGLKTLVSLHRTMGEAGQQLNADEVTIISAVLDLKEKNVGTIMTPMEDVFTLSLDDVLDEDTIDMILAAGYSRIPIHSPENDFNFVGMLLVKMLITYDPEDAKPVREFSLATLPETRPETSCLDIVNFFQEGKSHMVLVSENPGGDSGAIGVVTLEDVIEELIGEEIVDESDVFIDVHKAIRRLQPPPRTKVFKDRVPKGKIVTQTSDNMAQGNENTLGDIDEEPRRLQRSRTSETPPPRPKNAIVEHGSPRATTFMLRRRSSTTTSDKASSQQLRLKATDPQIREHLGHLGPSNLASKPRSTRYQNVKIKPGVSSDISNSTSLGIATPGRRVSDSVSDNHGGIGEGILSSAGKEASDGVKALHAGYGTITNGAPSSIHDSHDEVDKSVQTDGSKTEIVGQPPVDDEVEEEEERTGRDPISRSSSRSKSRSQSTIKSLPERKNSGKRSPGYSLRGATRSGSITENIVDVNGVRKLVLELTSSDDSNEAEEENIAGEHLSAPDDKNTAASNATAVQLRGGGKESSSHSQSKSKKKRRRRGKTGHRKGEEEPLLGGNSGQ
ncbi:hypothetical protein UCRPC4_g01227 [Phaeomoniella chlamydospora]|uniref:Duf21 and cbs domain protein n=1 Tax=Phaeomoniella chlamydospora TaxID=158046 RepID=A0A0G2GVG3_PHACM|nr:hypothetical protein UCRPC4_g01227 [Phaeomoniella chlamydospora]